MQNTPAIPPSPIPPMPSQVKSSDTLNAATLRKAIGRYYKELDEYKSKANYELALRAAFHNLLADGARQVGWTLVDEQTIEGGIRPDGVMRDANNLRRGYWEAKERAGERPRPGDRRQGQEKLPAHQHHLREHSPRRALPGQAQSL